MNRITLLRKIPPMRFVFGLALLILSVILVREDIKSLVLCGIAVYFLLTDGSQFDFVKNKYRTIKSIFGFHFGRWKPLPDIDYVSVFKTKENTTLRARTAETKTTNEVIKLNLFYDNNKKIEAYATQDKDDAFEKAKELAQLIQVDILDATQRESKWVNL